MEQARVVVCHAGVGSIMLARRCGKRPIVVPRRLHLGEAVDDHQLPIARRLHANGVVTLLEDVDRLRRGDRRASARQRLARPLGDDSGSREPGGRPARIPGRPGRRVNWARLFGLDKPNVKALARDGDIDGLIEAARYREVVRRVDGSVSDAGAIDPRGGDPRARGRPRETARARRSFARSATPRTGSGAPRSWPCYERGDDESLALAAAHLRDEDGQALVDRVPSARWSSRRPGAPTSWRLAIVHREDERPVSEADASILRELLDAEGAGAGSEVIDLLISALGRRARGRGRAGGGPARAAGPRERGRARDGADAGPGARARRRRCSAGSRTRARSSRSWPPCGIPSAQVRMESCVALGELRDPAASEPLLVATRDPEHLVRAGAGAALDRIGTAAIAVSVASLLRPLLEKAPDGARAGARDGRPAAARGHQRQRVPTRENGFHTTLLRRFARFIDRIEDARSGAASPRRPARARDRAGDLDSRRRRARDLVPARAGQRPRHAHARQGRHPVALEHREELDEPPRRRRRGAPFVKTLLIVADSSLIVETIRLVDAHRRRS